MRKCIAVLLCCTISALHSNKSFGQGYQQSTMTISQQNQQNININLPIIEKKVYVDRYRTVYVEKPRVARKLNAPVQLLGYIWVYPEDLGTFKSVPQSIIANINSQSPYGRNNWRIPTPDELAVLEANADKVGLGNDIYLATDHRNGVLRLVSTGMSVSEYVTAELNGEFITYAGIRWATKNVGASDPKQEGNEYEYRDVNYYKPPKGWRLPTISEMRCFRNYVKFERVSKGTAGWAYYGGGIFHVSTNSCGVKEIYIPYNKWWGAEYWCVGDDGRPCRVSVAGGGNVERSSYDISEACVRLVME